jgi:hypothetical protein
MRAALAQNRNNPALKQLAEDPDQSVQNATRTRASQYSEAEINQCFDFAASRLRVKPGPVESHAKP